jgi:hypothetical protein
LIADTYIYFFSDQSGMTGFLELAKALVNGGRKLPLLPPVERGIYQVETKAAAARVKVGADVLPWWPIRGMYVLLEANASAPAHLTEVDGVAGVWSGASQSVDVRLASAPAGQTISYCFLDEDPVQTAQRLRPVVENGGATTASSHCSPLPFTPWCPTSGIAMCLKGFGCGSA